MEPETASSSSSNGNERPLSLDEYKRYGRQMIMPDFGLPGQLKLKSAKVAVIGAGGLGCPVLQYLVGAGVGTVAIFDHDTVSISNLHRQILHATDRVGMNKAESACISLTALNPHVRLLDYDEAIEPYNASDLLRPYDILVDCTDRPQTRYLLSDVSVQLSISLVSGAAISTSGQWAVYGGKTPSGRRRACYRCLWPEVLPGAGNDRCEEVGVLGVVTGLVGCGMAGEVMKLLIGTADEESLLHLVKLGGNPMVRTVRMRGPRKECIACEEGPTIIDYLGQYGYEDFCSGPAGVDGDGANVERIGVKDFAELYDCKYDLSTNRTVVIDTRPEVEYAICSLPKTTSSSPLYPLRNQLTVLDIPLSTMLSSPDAVPESADIVFICRRGQDSQVAAAALAKAGRRRVKDVIGGLEAWSRDVDPTFPTY